MRPRADAGNFNFRRDRQPSRSQDRWQAGDSLHEIARLLDRSHGTVGGQISKTGGIRPMPRSRPSHALSLAEREEISRGIVADLSIRTIAAQLCRAVDTETLSRSKVFSFLVETSEMSG